MIWQPSVYGFGAPHIKFIGSKRSEQPTNKAKRTAPNHYSLKGAAPEATEKSKEVHHVSGISSKLINMKRIKWFQLSKCM